MMIERIRTELKYLKALDPTCHRVFCSTCGGKAAVADQLLSKKSLCVIEEALATSTLNELFSLGEWFDYLYKLLPSQFNTIAERESKLIDANNVEVLDMFVFKGRKYFFKFGFYKDVLLKASMLVHKTRNHSLMETLVITMGPSILKDEELYRLALSMKSESKEIHRALYNTLRDIVPEVRDYKLYGSTQNGCKDYE